MHKIVFLIPYFGKWPEWIDLYFDSLSRNPAIDFHFFTDCNTTVTQAKNVIFHSMTFEEYVEQAKQKIGFPANVPNPYKICDLRPFFGIIHEDIIQDYDFFGWTDVDLLFGDIRSFYTDNILKNHDVLSSHAIRLAGHCALLRNTDKHRKLGFKVYNWQKALTKPEFVGIDEHGMTNALCMTFWDRVAEKFKIPKNNFILNALRKWKKRRYYMVEQYSTPFIPIPWIDGSINSDQPKEWYYHQGEITNNRDGERKFMYIHFMNFKSSQWRADGTKAPWEGMEKYCRGEFSTSALINEEGIFYKSEKN